MVRRIGRLIQAGIFAAALPAGVAFAQGSGASGTAAGMPSNTGVTDKTGGQGTQSGNGLPGTSATTDDNATPAQKKANQLDQQQAPSLPGDTARPGELPNPPDTPSTPSNSDKSDKSLRNDVGSSSSTSDSTSSDTSSTTPGSGATDTDMHKSKHKKSSHIEKKSVKTSTDDKIDDTGMKSDSTLDNGLKPNSSDKTDLQKDQLDSDK